MRLSCDVLKRTAGLSLGAMRLMVALEQHCRTDPSGFPSNRRLAVEVGCSPRRVRSGLEELEKAGWIRRVIDPKNRSREEIVMIRRLDPGMPIGSREGVGRKRPRGRTKTSGEGRTETSARIMTQSEEGLMEQADGRYSAHADRCPRGRGRSTRSAGVRPRADRKDRMSAREMDAAILEYARHAGTPEPHSAWASPVVEPFQAPA